MNISLTPELEKYVNEKVKSGRYTSVSEVMREALRCMQDNELQRQRIDQLNREIDIGLMQLKSGQKIPAKEAFDEFRTRIKNATSKK